MNSALRRWIKQLQQGRNSITLRARRIPPPEQQKLLELEARTNRLAREKAIFKKTTALLMSDELERTRS
ncbi:hypothetical protein D3C78_1418870 [compost metagenome]